MDKAAYPIAPGCPGSPIRPLSRNGKQAPASLLLIRLAWMLPVLLPSAGAQEPEEMGHHAPPEIVAWGLCALGLAFLVLGAIIAHSLYLIQVLRHQKRLKRYRLPRRTRSLVEKGLRWSQNHPWFAPFEVDEHPIGDNPTE
jgi:heme exporter protein D